VPSNWVNRWIESESFQASSCREKHLLGIASETGREVSIGAAPRLSTIILIPTSELSPHQDSPKASVLGEQIIAMAPDRGYSSVESEPSDFAPARDSQTSRSRNEVADMLARRADDPRNFTLRGVLVGLAIGTLICFSNMYFGLQTGWISSMAMPSALLGFSYFKLVSRWIAFPFSPVENVLVQSVAGAVGTMPLGCGFVGVLPALNYMLTPAENGPLNMGTWTLIVWAVGIAFFGVVFAVPLRKQVIIREKLKFPSGTASALMIGVLHGEKEAVVVTSREDASKANATRRAGNGIDGVDDESISEEPGTPLQELYSHESIVDERDRAEWKGRIRLLLMAFAFSAFYVSYKDLLLLLVVLPS
jgi:hypothetical protein